jgi:hypothetical protein
MIRTSGNVPHDYQWSLLSDLDFDRFSGDVDAGALYQQATLMFRCPQSDHLWIYWDGLGRPPSLYSPGEDQTQG